MMKFLSNLFRREPSLDDILVDFMTIEKQLENYIDASFRKDDEYIREITELQILKQDNDNARKRAGRILDKIEDLIE